MIVAKRLLHKVVIHLRLEEMFVELRRRASFFRRFIPLNIRHKFASFGRFIPHSSSYPKNDSYLLTRDNTSFKINRSDYVQWRIFYGVRDNALRYAKNCLASDSIVMDIGANCGAFSLKLATHARENQLSNFHIHSFEPNPTIYNNYIANLELNPSLTGIVHAHPVGLGKENGEHFFSYNAVNTGAGRVQGNASSDTFKVNIQRLDDFVSRLNPPNICFIKLIVEGFEPEVLKGGWQTITKFRPPIFFEVTPVWYKENNATVMDVLSSLRSLGYSFMGEHHNEMIPYDESIFENRLQYNLLADINFAKLQ